MEMYFMNLQHIFRPFAHHNICIFYHSVTSKYISMTTRITILSTAKKAMALNGKQVHKGRFGIQILPLEQNPSSIALAAETVSLSFSPDPLIQWLLSTSAPSWGELTPAIQKFQSHRLAWDLATDIVVRASIPDGDPFAGIATIRRPQRAHWTYWFNWRRMWRCAQLYWTELFMGNIGAGAGCNEKRLEQMFKAHTAAYNSFVKDYPKNSVWYIEVVCVKPSCQGKGVGKAMLEWILNEAGESPCFLECTDQDNVAFYEKFGFEVMEIGELVDVAGEKGCVRLFNMVRKGSKKSS